MEDTWDLDQMKKSILDTFPSSSSSGGGSGLPTDPKLFRIREKLARKLTKVFHSDRNLRLNCSAGTLKDYKVLVVQEVGRKEEADISSQDVLINLQQWIPSEKKLSSIKEYILKSDMKLVELQKMISEEIAAVSAVGGGDAESTSSLSATSSSSSSSSILPPECIGFEKPLPYQLSDPSQLSSLKFNVDWVTSECTLANSQVIRVRDGDTLVWVDQRANHVEQYNEYRESDDIVHGGRRGEREKHKELKIYSPQEQAAMAATAQQ